MRLIASGSWKLGRAFYRRVGMARCCLGGGCVTVMVLELELFLLRPRRAFSLVLPHLDRHPPTPVAPA